MGRGGARECVRGWVAGMRAGDDRRERARREGPRTSRAQQTETVRDGETERRMWRARSVERAMHRRRGRTEGDARGRYARRGCLSGATGTGHTLPRATGSEKGDVPVLPLDFRPPHASTPRFAPHSSRKVSGNPEIAVATPPCPMPGRGDGGGTAGAHRLGRRAHAWAPPCARFWPPRGPPRPAPRRPSFGFINRLRARHLPARVGGAMGVARAGSVTIPGPSPRTHPPPSARASSPFSPRAPSPKPPAVN